MKIILLFFSLMLSFSCFSQNATTFILVRHSEKANDGTKDPPLNKEGKQRSARLAEIFSMQEIGALYSTPYVRTQQTLQPLADMKNVELVNYDPNSGKEWLKQVIRKHKGETIIISGHSNTIPTLCNLLIGKEVFTQFDDTDYSNLIIIVGDTVGNGKLVRMKF